MRAQALRDSYRETAKKVLSSSPKVKTELDALRQRLPDQALTDNGDSLRLPFSRDGLKMALLNAERYADRNVRRQLKAERVKMPDSWKAEIDKAPHAPPEPKVRPHACHASMHHACCRFYWKTVHMLWAWVCCTYGAGHC